MKLEFGDWGIFLSHKALMRFKQQAQAIGFISAENEYRKTYGLDAIPISHFAKMHVLWLKDGMVENLSGSLNFYCVLYKMGNARGMKVDVRDN